MRRLPVKRAVAARPGQGPTRHPPNLPVQPNQLRAQPAAPVRLLKKGTKKRGRRGEGEKGRRKSQRHQAKIARRHSKPSPNSQHPTFVLHPGGAWQRLRRLKFLPRLLLPLLTKAMQQRPILLFPLLGGVPGARKRKTLRLPLPTLLHPLSPKLRPNCKHLLLPMGLKPFRRKRLREHPAAVLTRIRWNREQKKGIEERAKGKINLRHPIPNLEPKIQNRREPDASVERLWKLPRRKWESCLRPN